MIRVKVQGMYEKKPTTYLCKWARMYTVKDDRVTVVEADLGDGEGKTIIKSHIKLFEIDEYK
jgi:hypothetical protein